MEYLKRHTVEEFEQMPEEVCDSYLEALDELCCELGIDTGIYTTPFGTEKAKEDAVIKLIERVQMPNKKRKGIKLTQIPNWDKNVIWKTDRHIDKCRKALIDIIKSYIGNGNLILGKTLKQVDYFDETYVFAEICHMWYEDEVEYLCPNKNDAIYDESNWIRLEDVTLENLLIIITLIKNEKATLLSPSERLTDDYIKETILKSGLVTKI